MGFFSYEFGNIWSVEETGLICHYCFRPVHHINNSVTSIFLHIIDTQAVCVKLKLEVNSEVDVED